MRVTPNRAGFERLRSAVDALRITAGDLGGPILISVGQTHRKQMTRIFVSEGAEGGAGKWPALHPRYAQRKRAVIGRRKILHLTGDTRSRFTQATSPHYIQRFLPVGMSGGVYYFGAESDVAAAHLYGNPGLAPLRSVLAGHVFGGRTRRLPRRDMIAKTARQIEELRERIVRWYIDKRIPQALRFVGGGPRRRGR